MASELKAVIVQSFQSTTKLPRMGTRYSDSQFPLGESDYGFSLKNTWQHLFEDFEDGSVPVPSKLYLYVLVGEEESALL